METIVVGVDGSEASLNALDLAAALARDLPDVQLVVLYSSFTPYFFPQEAEVDLDISAVEAKAQKINDLAKMRLDGTDTPWVFERRDGEPARELSQAATALDARLVIVGRSGTGSMREVMVGSVSNRLVHHMDCPVLLV